MSGLVLSLRANEKFLVNGALLINGTKRSQIRIGDDNANVLRLSDALHPNEVTTPVRRIYYAAQLILSGDAPSKSNQHDIKNGLNELEVIFSGTPLHKQITKAKEAAIAGRLYSLLCALKPLLLLESELLKVDLPSICRPALESNVDKYSPKTAKPYPLVSTAVIHKSRPKVSVFEKTG